MTRRAAILLTAAATAAAQPKKLTAGEIIARIQKQVAVPWRAETVDNLKSGTMETPVTGIATTFMSTLEVLQKAVAEGKNMVITHEPTFYQGDDNTRDTATDPTVLAKKAFIEKHNIAIFRFHDHWHMRRPDGIREGMMKERGDKSFPYPMGDYSLMDKSVKEANVAYQKSYVLNLLAENGFEVTHFFRGSWSGITPSDLNEHQDILIIKKN